MSDKEKEKPDFRKVADRNYDYYGSDMQSFIEGCEHVWRTEVVKRDEEINMLRKLIHDHILVDLKDRDEEIKKLRKLIDDLLQN